VECIYRCYALCIRPEAEFITPSFVEVSGHNLESVLGLNVSVYNVYIIKQFQTTFAQVGGGGGSQ
jgi:hypothetical protein